MASESNEDYSFDYDENSAIDDDDSILSGESGKRTIPEINLYQLLSKKRKFIHFVFRRITIISLIITFTYNIFWIIKMKKIEQDNNLVNYNSFRDNIVFYCYIVLIKGLLILLLPQVFCGSEKRISDLSYICVIIKCFTSFIISKYLTSNMNKKLELDKNFKIFDIKNCLYYWINLYYLSECVYIKLIYAFILILVCSVLIKIIKELLKAISYIF